MNSLYYKNIIITDPYFLSVSKYCINGLPVSKETLNSFIKKEIFTHKTNKLLELFNKDFQYNTPIQLFIKFRDEYKHTKNDVKDINSHIENYIYTFIKEKIDRYYTYLIKSNLNSEIIKTNLTYCTNKLITYIQTL